MRMAKWILVLATTAAAMAVWMWSLSKGPAPAVSQAIPAKEAAAMPVQKERPRAEAVTTSAKNEALRSINQEIAQATSKLDEIYRRLNHAGFPEVLHDDRLSENERLSIMSQLDEAGRLSSQLMHLKNRRVDLQVEAL